MKKIFTLLSIAACLIINAKAACHAAYEKIFKAQQTTQPDTQTTGEIPGDVNRELNNANGKDEVVTHVDFDEVKDLLDKVLNLKT